MQDELLKPLQSLESLLDRHDAIAKDAAGKAARLASAREVAALIQPSLDALCKCPQARRDRLMSRALASLVEIPAGPQDMRGIARVYVASAWVHVRTPERASQCLETWFADHPNHLWAAKALEQLVRAHLDARKPQLAADALESYGDSSVRGVADRSLLGLLRSEVFRSLGKDAIALTTVEDTLGIVDQALQGSEELSARLVRQLQDDRRWLLRDQGELFMAAGRNLEASAVFAGLAKAWSAVEKPRLAAEMRVFHANAAYVVERLKAEYPRAAYDELNEVLLGPLPARVRAVGLLDALRIGFAEHARAEAEGDTARMEIVDSRIRSHLDAVREVDYRGQQNVTLRAVFAHQQARLLPDPDRSAEEQQSDRERCAAELQELARGLLAHWQFSPPESAGRGFLERIDPRMIVSELLWTHLVGVEEQLEKPDALIADLCRVGAASRLGAVGTAATKDADKLASLAEIRALLIPRDSGILVFFPDYFGVHVVAIDADDVRWWRLPTSFAELNRHNSTTNKTVFAHPEEVRKWTKKQLARVDKRLVSDFGELVPAFARERIKGWTSLTIVGGGFIGRFPFEAVLEQGGGLLGERVAIGYLPSLQYGVARSRGLRKLPRQAKVLAFTVDSRDQEAADGSTGLWLQDSELAQLRARFADLGDDVVYASDDVTSAMVRETLAEPLGVMHWIAHAGRAPGQVVATVKLADGPLTSDAMQGVSFRGLAIMSACSAGSGAWRLGEGQLTTTLGGAMLRAGARAVITPITEIPVADHLLFVDLVQEAVLAGASPAAACRDARRERALADPKDRVGRLTRALVQVHGLAQQPVWEKKD